jgi:Secretion system C-terminal sorting domain
VLLNVSAYTGNVTIQARGANGSRTGFQSQCPGPGGGGGGGVIWANSSLPVNVITSVTGGVAGIINDAAENPSCELSSQTAAAGSNGIVLNNFTITYEAVFNCLGVLPSPNIINWSGRKVSQGVSLKWEVINGEGIVEVAVERKVKNGSYAAIRKYQHPYNGQYNFMDDDVTYPSMYRLAVVLIDGTKEYTRRLFFDDTKINKLNVYPNPAINQLQVQLPLEKGTATIIVHDFTGRIVFTRNILNLSAQKFYILPLHQLHAGVYSISCYINGEVWQTKFIKQ